MTKDTSGPAFARACDDNCFAQDGMTLRQYAAIKAMAGLLANSNGPVQANAMCGWSLCNCTENDVAALSVKLADALLAELEK